jgi:hypothetical protein
MVARTLVLECTLFTDIPVLFGSADAVRASVSVDNLRQFLLALGTEAIKVMNANICGSSLLRDEFRFVSFRGFV